MKTNKRKPMTRQEMKTACMNVRHYDTDFSRVLKIASGALTTVLIILAITLNVL